MELIIRLGEKEYRVKRIVLDVEPVVLAEQSGPAEKAPVVAGREPERDEELEKLKETINVKPDSPEDEEEEKEEKEKPEEREEEEGDTILEELI